jgi:hypothetical protein
VCVGMCVCVYVCLCVCKAVQCVCVCVCVCVYRLHVKWYRVFLCVLTKLQRGPSLRERVLCVCDVLSVCVCVCVCVCDDVYC